MKSVRLSLKRGVYVKAFRGWGDTYDAVVTGLEGQWCDEAERPGLFTAYRGFSRDRDGSVCVHQLGTFILTDDEMCRYRAGRLPLMADSNRKPVVIQLALDVVDAVIEEETDMLKVKCPVCLQEVEVVLYNRTGACFPEHDDGTGRERFCQTQGFVQGVTEIFPAKSDSQRRIMILGTAANWRFR